IGTVFIASTEHSAIPFTHVPRLDAAAAQGGSQVNLSWVDNSSNEEGFLIERSLNGAPFQVIHTTGPNVRAYASTGLQNNTRYYFRVRAYNALGFSAYSNTANARTKQR
ncbi:MAG: fibronectin type III domain-containing protein, partial [Gammaproteobacteria bacterium]